jgi:hypothetical protein
MDMSGLIAASKQMLAAPITPRQLVNTPEAMLRSITAQKIGHIRGWQNH